MSMVVRAFSAARGGLFFSAFSVARIRFVAIYSYAIVERARYTACLGQQKNGAVAQNDGGRGRELQRG
jgi:hypothetical protein